MDIAELVQSRSARPLVRRRRGPPLAALALTALGGLALAGMLQPEESPAPAPSARVSSEAEAPETGQAVPNALAWMLDPAPVLDTASRGFVRQAPQVSAFRAPPVPEPVAQEAVATLAALPAQAADAVPVVKPQPASVARVALTVPLPLRRPEEFRYEPRTQTARAATARIAATARASAEPTRSVFSAAVTDNRNFLEKMFDLPGSGPSQPASSEPAMAYAGLDSGAVDSAARRRVVPGPVSEPGVAVYDISAATVTLPSGEVLEAHSGLGVAQDNPDYVHVRMRGATPPGVYDLREREALFHGVRAIRLTPVGGSAAIHGRDGILAHTYMLGPSGASNGCVVFRNYTRFLQAYLRGEVRRLVVVPGTAPGVFASRRGAPSRRSASAAN
ncbi:Tlde1 domain-containing protein [Methylorubrum thiocyanatum]